MAITKVFRSGNSTAIRIPKEFRLDTKEVEILRRGEELIVRPVPRTLGDVVAALPPVSADFFAKGRRQPPLDRRKKL